MNKRITPFSILAIAIGIYCIYVMFADETGWGFIFSLIVIPIALVIWFVDVGLKRWLKTRKKIFGIEILLIVIGIGIYQYGERIKTLEIESDFDKQYVSIIYGVENGKDLEISKLDWNKTIKIPNNGILYTSSEFDENLPRTKMKFDSGIYLGSENTDRKFTDLTESEIELNGVKYKYRAWKLVNGFCCMTSTEDIEKVESELKSEWQKAKKASR
tara:strand:- start:26 stop:670 length:645 start_codon:yes stop_codon:yes gene_type:complete